MVCERMGEGKEWEKGYQNMRFQKRTTARNVNMGIVITKIGVSAIIRLLIRAKFRFRAVAL